MSRILLANGSPDVHGSEKYPGRKSMENSKRSGKGIFLYGTDSRGKWLPDCVRA